MARSEAPLNIEFDRFLSALTPDETILLLTDWMGMPNDSVKVKLSTPTARSFLPIPNGVIDEFISFGDDIGIAIELKDKWQTSPGQLEQYFDYANEHYNEPFLLFLTRSPDDIQHRWISPLFNNRQWYHRTWASLSHFLSTNTTLQDNDACRQFSDYIASLDLNIEIRRAVRDYGLNVGLPNSITVDFNSLLQTKLPSDEPLGCWKTGTEFWEDILQSIRTQLGALDFFSYRFDLYHYMFRWAFHERGTFFDMRKDNKWKYYYDYFMAHMEKTHSNATRVTMSAWYRKYLQIAKNQYVKLKTYNVGVVKVNSEDCYFVTEKQSDSATIQRLNFWEAINW